MTDRTNKGRNLDDALNRLYHDWNEQVSAPRLTYMDIREHLGEQERPSLLSQVTAPFGNLAAKWRLPVTKSQIGSITAVAAIIVLVAIYIIIIGPGSNDAEEIVPVEEPTATAEATVDPTATTEPDPTAAPTPAPEPTPTVEPTPTQVPIDPEVAAIIGDAKLKEFPAELMDGAPELPEEEVIRLWTEFVSDTYWVESADYIISYCEEGYGATPSVTAKPEYEAMGWNWEIIGPKKFPAQPWNTVRVILDGKEPPAIGDLSMHEDFGRITTDTAPTQGLEGPTNPLVYENNSCFSAAGPDAEPTPLPTLPESEPVQLRPIPEVLASNDASVEDWVEFLSDIHMIAVAPSDPEALAIDPNILRYMSFFHGVNGSQELLLCGNGRYHYLGSATVTITDYTAAGWTGGQDGSWSVSGKPGQFVMQLLPDDPRVILKSVAYPLIIKDDQFHSTLLQGLTGTPDIQYEVHDASGCN